MVAPLSPSNLLLLTATQQQEQAVTTDFRAPDVACKQDTFSITVYTPTGVQKYHVVANVPANIPANDAKTFWQITLEHLVKENVNQIPQSRETFHITVDTEGLIIQKDKSHTTHIAVDNKVQEACASYAMGNASRLTQALRALESTPSSSPSTAPPRIEHTTNSCYLAVTIQALLNSPTLLDRLATPAAEDDAQNVQVQAAALEGIDEITKTCIQHQTKGERVPKEVVLRFREALTALVSGTGELAANDASAQDAITALSLIYSAVADKVSPPLTKSIIRSSHTNHALLSTQEEKNYTGVEALPVIANSTVHDLFTSHLKPHAIEIAEGGGVNVTAADGQRFLADTEEYKISAPPAELYLTFVRDRANEMVNPTEVLSPFTMGEDVLTNPGTEQNKTYHPSTVVLYTRGRTDTMSHYTAIVVKRDVEGNPHYYFCDDIGGNKELTLEECEQRLQNSQCVVVSATYTRQGTDNLASQSSTGSLEGDNQIIENWGGVA